MPKNRIFLIAALLLLASIAALLFLRQPKPKPASTQQTVTVNVITVENTAQQHTFLVDAAIVQPNVQTLSFPVAGLLEKGAHTLRRGSSFKQGELLLQVNNAAAFTQLATGKKALQAQLVALLPAIERQFPAEAEKWKRFAGALKPQQLLPPLPENASPAEREFLQQEQLLGAYDELVRQERAMPGYFCVAPYDGIVVEVKRLPGKPVRSGQPVLVIARPGKPQLRASYTAGSFFQAPSVVVQQPDGTQLGSATLVSAKTNARTRMTEVIYEPTNGRSYVAGTPLQLVTEQTGTVETFTVHQQVLNGNSVQLLIDGCIETVAVQVVEKSGETVTLKGLKNGEQLVLSPVKKIEKRVRYVVAQ